MPCPRLSRRLALAATLAAALPFATTFTARAQGAALPPEVDAALARARVPREAVSILVVEAQARTPRLAWRAQVPMNPASVMKLATTYAGLDLLGPAYAWNTSVYLDGPVQGGVLQGNAYIQGRGDPKLVVERLWLLLRRLQGQGVQAIAGDIVLDRSAFALPPADPAGFDGEPLRPYNAAPDALLVNYKSIVMTFVPDPAAGSARVVSEPPLAGVQMPATVALAAPGAECGDWRGALKADFSAATRVAFDGVYPAACGERAWPVAYADPGAYAARAIEGMWREIGGRLAGRVRDGRVPEGLPPAFGMASPALAEVIRDINKYSNNVMAQQLFLTLSLQRNGTGTPEGSREVLRQWWRERFGEADMPVFDNGAGLSRDGRISAQALARMLQAAWQSPLMPELASSLPISGVDGTLRRSQTRFVGAAHLKTGSLRDVAAVAGYVHAPSGRRYILVAFANHANAGALRPAFDALVDWTARE
ncbi:D-alanyl-D-alanine carboxypeptidase/D-alanyl-D-alanine-endopeptidase [Ramlibacter sp. H39-3-26]|uniref:D-alanyl-D-alanine carboxypeptidase/D-alanyl-D-alanine endopeptidase n=1 Tax=Curvibacter soli TaxID=3031331 RepID=UPI0023DCAAB1|nr:D-alanyl-D-alanine carboxypeptidase/D-alanyl-D-alanine-endopeptidase [Ramlibacter sp. H39-3-26]MDF1484599.1 D-alanyl-D-alanine carboxypeptidase/D-alanyl-D-alanine-endopeptidase [Ramlibacter sp. H39-3-26]